MISFGEGCLTYHTHCGACTRSQSFLPTINGNQLLTEHFNREASASMDWVTISDISPQGDIIRKGVMGVKSGMQPSWNVPDFAIVVGNAAAARWGRVA